MPERNGPELTMFSAAGFAVVADGRNAAGLGQAAFKLLELFERHKVILFAREDQHVTLDALRQALVQIALSGRLPDFVDRG
jgi:hypothetical protein